MARVARGVKKIGIRPGRESAADLDHHFWKNCFGNIQHAPVSTLAWMLADLRILIEGLILFSPTFVLGLAWARSGRFYSNKPTLQRQKILYFLALVAATISTLGYLAYWGWRVCTLYEITFPFIALLTLERLIWGCRLLSAVAIPCLMVGRGPYRALLALIILWVMFQVWIHSDIIHWA